MTGTHPVRPGHHAHPGFPFTAGRRWLHPATDGFPG